MLQGYDLKLTEHTGNSSPPRVEDPYDMIIIDSNGHSVLPIEACAEIRRRVTEPLVLVTQNQDEEYQVQAYSVGVDECIIRPISGELLYAKLTRWLRWSVPAEEESQIAPAPS